MDRLARNDSDLFWRETLYFICINGKSIPSDSLGGSCEHYGLIIRVGVFNPYSERGVRDQKDLFGHILGFGLLRRERKDLIFMDGEGFREEVGEHDYDEAM